MIKYRGNWKWELKKLTRRDGVEYTEPCYYMITSGDGYHNKHEEIGFDLTGYMDEKDAKLIASSPDLLMSLELIVNSINENDVAHLFPKTLKIAIQSIKKATE